MAKLDEKFQRLRLKMTATRWTVIFLMRQIDNFDVAGNLDLKYNIVFGKITQEYKINETQSRFCAS